MAGTLRVLDAQPMPSVRHGNTLIDEWSDLAWDAHEKRLLAVSDRGWLLTLDVPQRGDHLGRLLVQSLHPLHAMGGRGSSRVRNVEALAVVPRHPGQAKALVVAIEWPPSLWLVSSQGQVLQRLALPPTLPVVDPTFARSIGHRRGLEALAWHPVKGLLLAVESPPAGQPGTLHTLYSASESWSFRQPADGPSRLKALAMQSDGSLLTLERQGPAGAHRTLLRRVDLRRCGGTQLCSIHTLGQLPVAFAEHNFEGLACPSSGRCLVVSDNGGRRDTPSLLLWLALPPVPTLSTHAR